MAQLGRPGISSQQRSELWSRWQNGESVSDIARALQKNVGSIFGVLRLKGGYAPKPRLRRAIALTLDERECISRGLSAGISIRAIAAELQRSPSTVSREIEKNGGRIKYRAVDADQKAWDRGRRPKECRLATDSRLCRLVAKKLAVQWSPQQIAGWLRVQNPGDPSLHVSHETIYKTLFVQTRGALKKELQQHLRSQRVMRHARTATRKGQTRYRIIDAISISDRPAQIEDRSIPGHWQGDLLTGKGNTHIATLVERQSRFTILIKLRGKNAAIVADAMSRRILTLPKSLRSSVTLDRGPEFSAHKAFSIISGVKVYFCDPQSPWQRGTNENTNRLLRHYFPDGTDFSQVSQRELDQIANRLNKRPRKTLRYSTPAERIAALLP